MRTFATVENFLPLIIIGALLVLFGIIIAVVIYVKRHVKPLGIKVSRIASGVPVGGDLECIDNVTLLRALQGRVTI